MKYFFSLPIFVALFALHANAATIVIKDDMVSPSEITFAVGEKIEFSIQNLSQNFDGFKSEGIDVEIEHIPVHGIVTVSIPALKAGMYPFIVKLEGSLMSLGVDKKIHGNIVVK